MDGKGFGFIENSDGSGGWGEATLARVGSRGDGEDFRLGLVHFLFQGFKVFQFFSIRSRLHNFTH